MSEGRKCPQCGAELAAGAALGVCPSCVQRAGPDWLLEESRGGAGSTTRADSRPNRGGRPAESEGHPFGRYELLEEVGRGGMGVVYKARQPNLNRTVALKMIRSGQLASRVDLERFQTEAEAVGRLKHPGIVEIYEAGEQDGFRYLCMEYIEGQSLAARLSRGPFSSRAAAETVRALAAAVAHAHEHGVIHRDLKPGNILLDDAGDTHLMDFGLARQMAEESDLTETGQVLGTAAYMPPEQASGDLKQLGPAADIYGLGAILYELLTGRPPFQSASQIETLRQVREDEPVAPRRLTPSVSRDLETICLKCLEKEPSRRYAGARELEADLRRFLEHRPVHARPINRLQRLARWARRNAALATLTAGLAISLLCGLIGVTLLWYQADAARERAERISLLSQLAQKNLRLSSPHSTQPERQQDARQALREAIREIPLMRDPSAVRETLRDRALNMMVAPAAVKRVDRVKYGPPRRWVAFNSDLTQFAVPCDEIRAVSIRRLRDNREIMRLDGVVGADYLTFSPNDRFLATRHSHTCSVWDLASGEKIVHSPMNNDGMRFDPSGKRLAVATKSDEITLFTMPPPQAAGGFRVAAPRAELLRETIALSGVAAYDVVFHPARNQLAVTHGCDVSLLDIGTKAAVGNGRGRLSSQAGDIFFDLAFSATGNTFAVACGDHFVRVFDADTGQRLNCLSGHGHSVIEVQFQPGGHLLASSSWDGTTRLWDPVTGAECAHFPGNAVQFSSDGRRLACKWGANLDIYEIENGPVFHSRSDVQGPDTSNPHGMSFSRDPVHPVLATTGQMGVRLWDVHAVKPVALLLQEKTRSAIFHPNGRQLITSGDKGIQRWPLKWSGNEITIGPAEPLVIGKEFAHGYASLDGEGNALLAVRPHPRPGALRTAVVLRLDDPLKQRQLAADDKVAFVALSPDGRYAATGAWHGVGLDLWDTKTGQKLPHGFPNAESARAIFSPDGRWLLVNTGYEHQMLRLTDWTVLWRRPAGDSLSPLTFSSDSSMVALSPDRRSIELVAVADGTRLAYVEPPGIVFDKAAAFSPDGRFLALAGYNRGVNLWDLVASDKLLRSMGLGWDVPLPAVADGAERASPLVVHIVTGDSGTAPD